MVYLFLAELVLFLHVLWCAWILVGWMFTRGRPVLRNIHIAAIVWAIVVEILPWTVCPLTLLESWLETRAGLSPSSAPFLARLFDALVYPDLPNWLIITGAILVCVFMLFIYVRRFLHDRAGSF